MLKNTFLALCVISNFFREMALESNTSTPLGDLVTQCSSSHQATIYDFNMTTLEGDFIPFERLRNKIVLIVNVASFSKFTPQYIQLNQLMKTYGPNDQNASSLTECTPPKCALFNSCQLQVLGFPSNQFQREEPGYSFEIKNCLHYVRPGNGFVPAFPLSLKFDVNGKDETPLYTFLKKNCSTNGNIVNEKCAIWSPIRSNDIVWNFEKFLVDHHGSPTHRFQPMVEPLLMSKHIESLIENCKQELHKNDLFGTLDLNNTQFEQYIPRIKN